MDKVRSHKVCNKCLRGVLLAGFHRNSKAKDGLSRTCKECVLDHQLLFRDKEKHKISCRRSQAKRKGVPFDENKEPRQPRDEESRREYNRKYSADKRKNNIQFRLAENCRKRLRSALSRDAGRVGSGVRDLGCMVAELKAWLELHFVQGMSWANYGNKPGQWSIDHIMPLSKFDLTDRQHVVLACHYGNLQPMWHLDNISKGNRTA